MKRHVTIEFDVETTEYHECGESKADVLQLVEDMINPRPMADLPDRENIKITVE